MKVAAQIFLSYAREDGEKLKSLYQKLSDAGFRPWMDTKDILPGEQWKPCIQRAIQHSDFFLACLSAKSVKRGFLQKEINDALDIWQEMLDSDIYLIPVRLEDCQVPERLRDFQWVNLFEEDGWTRLVKAIQVGMERRAKVIKPTVQEPIPVESYPDLKRPSPDAEMVTPGEGSERVLVAYRASLTRRPEYARWADRPRVREEDEDHFIETEGKILPLFASPYDDTGQQREDLLEIIRTHDRLLVLGEPGVGKTVALERMMWETANAPRAAVPIYVPLSYYDGHLLNEVHNALTETGVLFFSSTRDLDTFLRQNQCLVLFDGLNEVRGAQRRQIVRDIESFVRAYRRHRYVFTSRSQDLLWQTFRDKGVIRNAVVIQPITDDQVREYLIAHLSDQKGSETHDRLNECLRGMSRTPLFLWMLKEVRLTGRELPGNRGELFDYFVESLFTQDEGKLEIAIPRSAKKQALAYLAFTLQQEHRVACQGGEAVAIVTRAGVGYDAQTLTREAQLHGLLKGKRQIRFMHQAVQEYFVALALREIVAAEVNVPALQQLGRRVLRRGLVAWAIDPWWAESFVQLAGLTDHPAWLAQMIAKVNSWLAFWCMIEGRPVDRQTQGDVEAGTVGLLCSDDVRKRQRAVRELGKLENPRTAEYLVDVLGDEAEEVVNVAVQGLGKLGEPAVEYLRPYLERDEGVRQAATRALGLVWQLPSLVDLGKADESLRLAALETLGQLGDTRAFEAITAVARWDTVVAVRERAVEALGQIGDTRAVGPLLAVLDDDEPSLRASAATALGQIGDGRATEPLTEALKDGNEAVRRRAIGALGRIWGLPALVRLGDDSGAVREEAATALGALGDGRAVRSLVATLRDKYEAVSVSAAMALAQLGDAQAVEPLISVLLTRKEPAARKSAAKALEKLGDRRAVEPLIAALKDQERDVQQNVAMALGRLRDERAIQPLIAMCKDRGVQESAIKALAQIGGPAVPPLIVALFDGERNARINAARVLGQIGGTEALEALLISLRDDRDGIVRASAAVMLGQVGGARAVKALVATLRGDKDRTVRVYAAMSLGQLGGAQAVEALTSTLKDEGEDEAVRRMAVNALGHVWNLPQLARLSHEKATVRQGAALALGQLGDKRAIEPLLATLRDRDEAVRRKVAGALGRIWGLPQLVRLGDDEAGERQEAATALGQLGEARAVEPLIAILQDSNAAVRLAAAKALGQLDDERAVQPLIDALDDNSKDVRRGAGEALQDLAPWAISGLISALRDSRYWFRRRRAAETLGQIGEPGPLIEALHDDDRYVRRNAIEALVRVGDLQAVEPLIAALLRDDDNYVRRKAAETLGRIGDIRAIKPLIKVLQDDEDWRVRWVVAEALGDIGDSSAVEPLVAALEDDEWPVRWMAAKALGKIGDPRAVGALIKALEGDWPALWTVAEALGELEDLHAVGPLVAVLRDSYGDKYVQHTAVEALGQIGELIQKPLIALLRDGDEKARQRAIAALGQLGDVRNLEPLIAALRDKKWSVHQGARRALVQIGKAAVEPLIAVLRDNDPFVRRRTVLALKEIGDARAVGPLITTLMQDKFPLVRQEAAEALHSIDTPEARAALRKYEERARKAGLIRLSRHFPLQN